MNMTNKEMQKTVELLCKGQTVQFGSLRVRFCIDFRKDVSNG